MAYNLPSGSASQGPPFFTDNMASSQFYFQEDDLVVQNAYMDKIDPLLRASRPSRSPQMGFQSQQAPIQRYMHQEERNFFTTGPMQHHPQGFPHSLNRPQAPISTLPQAPQHRMVSPTPSQDPTSTCSSARSPAPDLDWYDVQYSPLAVPRDDYPVRNDTSFLGQGFQDLWSGAPQNQTYPQLSFNGVNMSQIQGLPDPEEVTFDAADEGFHAMEMKAEYEHQSQSKSSLHSGTYIHNHYPIDEGLGTSIKDEASPADTSSTHHSIDVDVNNNSEIDAECDAEDEIIVADEHISDVEYTPKSTRTRKRRVQPKSYPMHKVDPKSRVTKPSHKNKGLLACKTCDQGSFKDLHALQKHIASSHTRAFICVFAFAGCPSTFASKNEWKRHVQSQHLNLSAWVCDLGACGKTNGKTQTRGSEFNRKDLFTQHLRRMHAPFSVKRQNKKISAWEEQLKELQTSCLIVKRQAPMRLSCPVQNCNVLFEGAGTWDDRMEHVGKHLEKAAVSGNNKIVVEQERDVLLLGWAEREGIIERRIGGGWRLVGCGRSEDEDAEGEDDV
ncbi:hypothetical protein B0J14DRAFT_40371 [Halenospora varia]|nr:hypothetical protein B0J14DRAFT_40371 [Halenospora varia]